MQVRALAQKIAAALDRLPGAILVVGHADATPPRAGTNAELSAARARAVARVMAKALADPKRLAIEGPGRCRAARARTTPKPTARRTAAW